MRRLTRVYQIGLIALLSALLLAMIDPTFALVPLTLYVLLYLLAPFLHRLGLFLTVISRGNPGLGAVALTFDDGPDPRTTPALLQLLAHHGVEATFFVIGERVANRHDLIKVILEQGHTIGNHGFHHDAWVAFKGAQHVMDEIEATQKVLAGLGVTPRLFRPPVGITYPAMGRALTKLGMTAVTFNCQAWDRGNRSITHLARRIMSRVKPGDIIMLHDGLPPESGDVDRWLGEVAAIIEGLQKGGIEIRPLAELIGRPVHGKLAA